MKLFCNHTKHFTVYVYVLCLYLLLLAGYILALNIVSFLLNGIPEDGR